MPPTAPSEPAVPDDRFSSARTGFATGVAFLVLYLVTGLLFAQWSLAAFFEHLTVETVLWLLVGSLSPVTVVAVPVFLYLQYRLVSPLALLAVVLLGWLAAGLFIGALFGLSLYVFGLAPLYLVLYLLLGGGERYLRQPEPGDTPPENGGETR